MQLDVEVSFELEKEAIEAADGSEAGYDCTTSGGAANRGVLGPFGIVVLGDEKLTELTPIYFYVAKGANGKAESHFCADELRLINFFISVFSILQKKKKIGVINL